MLKSSDLKIKKGEKKLKKDFRKISLENFEREEEGLSKTYCYLVGVPKNSVSYN